MEGKEIMSDLIVYSNARAPVSYIGELVSDTDQELIMEKVLILYQQPNRSNDSDQVTIGNLPFASRESSIKINKQSTPGVIITKPDTDLILHYNREILAAYSKLKVV